MFVCVDIRHLSTFSGEYIARIAHQGHKLTNNWKPFNRDLWAQLQLAYIASTVYIIIILSIFYDCVYLDHLDACAYTKAATYFFHLLCTDSSYSRSIVFHYARNLVLIDRIHLRNSFDLFVMSSPSQTVLVNISS